VNSAGPIRRTLICVLLVAETSGCGNLTVVPGDTHEAHCRELREKLADKNIAPDVATVGRHRKGRLQDFASRALTGGSVGRQSLRMNPKHRPGPPMTLGNMRELGVQRLVASALMTDRRVGLVSVWHQLGEWLESDIQTRYFKHKKPD
jgi:hypothetical protein